MLVIYQVQWNIFTVQSTDPALMLYQEECGGLATTKFYNPCREVEENYRKATTTETPSTGADGQSQLIIGTIITKTSSYIDPLCHAHHFGGQ